MSRKFTNHPCGSIEISNGGFTFCLWCLCFSSHFFFLLFLFIVCRYLQWLGINTRVFNVGNYRRKLHGAQQPHDFFDPANPEGERSRREAAVEALNDMIRWFKKDDGVVALYDATNSTRARREMLLAACKKHDIQVMFIESICQDESLVLHNIMDVKLSSPDYEDMDPEQAAEDFKARIVHYEEAYETITEENLTYIKLINVGSQVIISHIQGYLQSRIVYYLMNLHIAPRSIFFSRVSFYLLAIFYF